MLRNYFVMRERNWGLMENEHRMRILNVLRKIPQSLPAGWSRFDMCIGSLMYVGFSEIQTEKLMCISSQEQSVIDCRTGKVVFEEESYDEHNLIAISESLGGEVVHIAGLGGGGLRHYAPNGDIMDSIAPYYPKEQVVYMPEYKSCFLSPEECRIIFDDYELRTFGFSKCGNYMVIASASDLSVFRRL